MERGRAEGAEAIQVGLDTVQRLARELLQRERNLPTRPQTELPADLRLGVEGRPFADVTEALRRVLTKTPSSASPRFNNQLFGGRDSAAVAAALLVRRRGTLAENFSEEAGYLFQTHDDELDPGRRSIQCGRRNDALKLWAAWLHLGDAGFDRRIARFFELARYAADVVTADPELELVGAPESVNVCFTVRGHSSAAICERLDREARLKIGYGEAAGRQVIRLVCIDPDLDEQRIDDILAEIKAVSVEIGKAQSVGAVDDE